MLTSPMVTDASDLCPDLPAPNGIGPRVNPGEINMDDVTSKTDSSLFRVLIMVLVISLMHIPQPSHVQSLIRPVFNGFGSICQRRKDFDRLPFCRMGLM